MFMLETNPFLEPKLAIYSDSIRFFRPAYEVTLEMPKYEPPLVYSYSLDDDVLCGGYHRLAVYPLSDETLKELEDDGSAPYVQAIKLRNWVWDYEWETPQVIFYFSDIDEVQCLLREEAFRIYGEEAKDVIRLRKAFDIIKGAVLVPQLLEVLGPVTDDPDYRYSEWAAFQMPEDLGGGWVPCGWHEKTAFCRKTNRVFELLPPVRKDFTERKIREIFAMMNSSFSASQIEKLRKTSQKIFVRGFGVSVCPLRDWEGELQTNPIMEVDNE